MEPSKKTGTHDFFLQEKFFPTQWLESKFKKRGIYYLILNGWFSCWDNLKSLDMIMMRVAALGLAITSRRI